MEEWRPDRQFKKADFPRKEKEDAKKSRPRSSDASGDDRQANPSRGGNTDAAKKGIASERPAAAKSNGTRLQSWSVPKLGGGQVVAGGSQKERPNKQASESEATDSGASLQDGSNSGPTGAQKGSSRPTVDGSADVTRQYLSQLVVLDPRASGDVLRSWYWEKPGRSSPVQYVPPHNRIHLILRSLTKDSLLVLYEGMTPVERRQMEEIRKEPMHVNDREILKVRQYFMDRITGRV